MFKEPLKEYWDEQAALNNTTATAITTTTAGGETSRIFG